MKPELREVEAALTSVQETLKRNGLDECDTSDMQELIERVEQELEASRPNVQVIGTFLNSMARSLRSDPEARDVCSRIDDALRKVGVARTWTN